MRVAIIADSHFTERSRWKECLRVHEWIAKDIAVRGVDLVLHSGDLFDAKSTPTERIAVAEWLAGVAQHAPIVIVRGNHDALLDVGLMGKIRSKHPIIAEEGANVHIVAGVAVACLAWPRKAELLARLGATSHEASEHAAHEALRAVLLGFRQQLEQHDGPRILLTHAMVRGSRTTAGQPLVGVDLELGLDDLQLAGADFVALGHIHAHQTFDAPNIIYPGSPRRTEFGDSDPKGYLIVDIGRMDPLAGEEWPANMPRHSVTWTFVETHATPMLDLAATWDAESGTLIGTHRLTDIGGVEVRFRYTVAADQQDAARARAEEYRSAALARGAIVVKLEPQVQTSVRARAPEVAAARTLREKLLAYWGARGDELGGREEALLDKAGELEKEAAA